jgi:hypothetical protein
MFLTTKGTLQALWVEPIKYSGSCNLVYSRPEKIRIEGKNSIDRKGYFYQRLESDQRVFQCYSNKPCKCNSNIEVIIIPQFNLLLDLKSINCE